MHTEIPIKVNAWVDEGVAALVSALNEFENVQTLESCEGQDVTPSHVYFLHREGPQQTFAFLRGLAELLSPRLHSCCDYKLRLEWMPGAEQPLAEIVTRQEYVGTLANALTEIAANGYHTTQFDDGR